MGAFRQLQCGFVAMAVWLLSWSALPVQAEAPAQQGCVDIITNGDFEWDGAWLMGATAIPPTYAVLPAPVQSGSRSMALGPVLPGAPDVASFSSIQQAVTIPPTAQSVRISFWYYPISTAAAGGFDRQELILLEPLNYDQTAAVLWRVTENTNQWLYQDIDLTAYRGQTLSIYFNARNAGEGGRTAMYLDQVQVLACDTAWAYPEVEPYGVEAEMPAPETGAALEQDSLSLAALPAATRLSVATETPAEFSPAATPSPTPAWNEPAPGPAAPDSLRVALALIIVIAFFALIAWLLVFGRPSQPS